MMDMATYVRLLGIPGVRFEGVWTSPAWNKLTALIYYLAYRGDWVNREELAYLFWPDVPENNACSNLRKLIGRVWKELPFAAGLEAERTRLGWQVESDVAEGREALAANDPSRLIRLYTGELFQGFRLGEVAEFETWLETEREQWGKTYRKTALGYAGQLQTDGRYREAAEVLETLRSSDPLDEEVLQHQLRVTS